MTERLTTSWTVNIRRGPEETFAYLTDVARHREWSPDGCRLERYWDMPKPTGVIGAVFPLFLRAYIRPSVQKGMNLLKRNLESSRASAG